MAGAASLSSTCLTRSRARRAEAQKPGRVQAGCSRLEAKPPQISAANTLKVAAENPKSVVPKLAIAGSCLIAAQNGASANPYPSGKPQRAQPRRAGNLMRGCPLVFLVSPQNLMENLPFGPFDRNIGWLEDLRDARNQVALQHPTRFAWERETGARQDLEYMLRPRTLKKANTRLQNRP